MVKFSYYISDDAFNLLMYIQNKGYVEYRDPEYDSIEDFLRTKNVGTLTLKSFKARNCNGTYYLIDELVKYNLVDSSDDSWCPTYKLSDIAKDMLIPIIRKNKLEKLEK